MIMDTIKSIADKTIYKASLIIRAIAIFKNWPLLLMPMLKAVCKSLSVEPTQELRQECFRLRDGTKLMIRKDTIDINPLWLIFVEDTYIAQGFKAPFLEIGEDDTVVDIGAHIGIFSIYAARKAKKGRIFSYEPHPANFHLLKRNLDLNPVIENIKVFQMAVAAETGIRDLFLASDYGTACHGFYQESHNTIEVSCITIQEIFESEELESIDFCKMDCEGAEYEILLNLPEDYYRRIKCLSIEYHPVQGYRRNDLVNHLEKVGYQVAMHGNQELGIIYARSEAITP